jgi:hypothetical protein
MIKELERSLNQNQFKEVLRFSMMIKKELIQDKDKNIIKLYYCNKLIILFNFTQLSFGIFTILVNFKIIKLVV